MVFITEHLKPRKLGPDDYRYIGIPSSSWAARLDRVGELVRPIIKAYVDNRAGNMKTGQGLFLYGLPRCGKTCVAAGIAKVMFAYGYSVYFTHASTIREANRYSTKFDDEVSVLNRSANVDLLVIDDFTVEDTKNPFYGAEQFKQLLKLRTDWLRPSIVVTSVNLRDRTSRDTDAMEFIRKLPNMPVVSITPYIEEA